MLFGVYTSVYPWSGPCLALGLLLGCFLVLMTIMGAAVGWGRGFLSRPAVLMPQVIILVAIGLWL